MIRVSQLIFGGLVLMTSACVVPSMPRSAPEQSNPWESGSPWERPPAPMPEESARRSVMRGSEGENTTLELLQSTSEKLKMAEGEVDSLKSQLASLAGALEQARADNESIQKYADSIQSDTESSQTELTQLQERARQLESDYRTLAEDLLSERIQRVRVERELILARIAEAERESDG